MRRADLEFHSDCGPVHVACDVKLHGIDFDACTDLVERIAREEFGLSEHDARVGAAAWESLGDERDTWVDYACEVGWRRLNDTAREIYGPAARCYSEGRMGGWAVVSPGFERYSRGDRFIGVFTREESLSWDAIRLARWGRFVRACRETVADLPYIAAWGFVANHWEPAICAREESRRFSFYYDAPAEIADTAGGDN